MFYKNIIQLRGEFTFVLCASQLVVEPILNELVSPIPFASFLRAHVCTKVYTASREVFHRPENFFKINYLQYIIIVELYSYF